jgi:hypothetical protein
MISYRALTTVNALFLYTGASLILLLFRLVGKKSEIYSKLYNYKAIPISNSFETNLFISMKTSNRRKFLVTSAALTAGAAASAMSLTSRGAKTDNKYPVIHHVFFWLKNPGSIEDRDKLVAGVKTLSKIEAIRELRVGVVAKTEKRDVVDNSWAVSELLFFNDLADQAAYQTHPIHLEFIKNYGHLWEKVIVYDAVDA